MKYFVPSPSGAFFHDDGPVIPLNEGFEFIDTEYNEFVYRILKQIRKKEYGIFHNKVVLKQDDKYRVFFHQPVCQCCGKKALGWKLAISNEKKVLKRDIWRLVLVTKNSKGNLIQMEVDHIIPKSRGGVNKFENYQTLCAECNRRKGSMRDEKFKEKYKKEILLQNEIEEGF